ncbi:uncharacterized protein BcabD6B2_32070 [Babesia caballi]|uniref:Membrane protein, putative n=1 Tax=Babesia caballi TaxID=5871 RepID=A0AAV4LU48_BABCB|nr:membrane protein, putative [Babesia caballi]
MVAYAYVYTLIATITSHCSLHARGNVVDGTTPEHPPPEAGAAKTTAPSHGASESEGHDIVNDVALKAELSEAAKKLDESAKTAEETRKTLDGIAKEQARIHKEIGETNLQKIKDLTKRKKELLKKIASLGKTLRVEHDAQFPHLIGKPIVIVAKDEDDTKRAANTLAHLEGLRDAMNKVHSPCSSLERIRSTTLTTARQDKHNRFAVVQKTLDSMSAEERLHYDRNMIEHYEGIIREIEDGIAEADAEIAASWNNYNQ